MEMKWKYFCIGCCLLLDVFGGGKGGNLQPFFHFFSWQLQTQWHNKKNEWQGSFLRRENCTKLYLSTFLGSLFVLLLLLSDLVFQNVTESTTTVIPTLRVRKRDPKWYKFLIWDIFKEDDKIHWKIQNLKLKISKNIFVVPLIQSCFGVFSHSVQGHCTCTQNQIGPWKKGPYAVK